MKLISLAVGAEPDLTHPADLAKGHPMTLTEIHALKPGERIKSGLKCYTVIESARPLGPDLFKVVVIQKGNVYRTSLYFGRKMDDPETFNHGWM